MKLSNVKLRIKQSRPTLYSPVSTASREFIINHKPSYSMIPCSPKQAVGSSKSLKKTCSGKVKTVKDLSRIRKLDKKASNLASVLDVYELQISEKTMLLDQYKQFFQIFFSSIESDNYNAKDQLSKLLNSLKSAKEKYYERTKPIKPMDDRLRSLINRTKETLEELEIKPHK